MSDYDVIVAGSGLAGLTAGLSFAEYSSPTPVGQGQVDSDTLYFIDEKVGALGKAWYIFFDPAGSKDIFANITFDAPINVATSPVVAPGASETIQFAAPAPGDYAFHCTIHPGMNLTLRVR